MKVSEAVGRASTWWDLKGRHMVPPAFNRAVEGRKVSSGIVIAGDVVDVLPSGILRGVEWNLLELREQLQIVKWWHHFAVVVKDIENPTVSADDRDMMRRWGIQ
jgi:hypothetical protein